jgi:hypothetical protein
MVRNHHEEKRGRVRPIRPALIALLQSQGEEVYDPEPLTSALPDPGDAKFLACAKAVRERRFHRNLKRPTFPAAGVRIHPCCQWAELLDRITLEI